MIWKLQIQCWKKSILYQIGRKGAGTYRWYVDQSGERSMYGEPPCVTGYYCQKNNLPASSGYGGWCVKGSAPATTTTKQATTAAKPTTTTKKV